MTLRRHQIFGAVRTLLQASPYLQGVEVVPDLGSIESTRQMEVALRTKGIVIAVSPVLEQIATGDGRAGYQTSARFAVHVRTNPNRNAQMLQVDPDIAVEAVQHALLGAGSGLAHLPFTPAEPAVVLDTTDAPNLTHTLFWEIPIPVLPPPPAP
jgi:hypothetical protein